MTRKTRSIYVPDDLDQFIQTLADKESRSWTGQVVHMLNQQRQVAEAEQRGGSGGKSSHDTD